jgi:hypothetical protein
MNQDPFVRIDGHVLIARKNFTCARIIGRIFSRGR